MTVVNSSKRKDSKRSKTNNSTEVKKYKVSLKEVTNDLRKE